MAKAAAKTAKEKETRRQEGRKEDRTQAGQENGEEEGRLNHLRLDVLDWAFGLRAQLKADWRSSAPVLFKWPATAIRVTGHILFKSCHSAIAG